MGDYMDEYDKDALPANVRIDSWYPQPGVIPRMDIWSFTMAATSTHMQQSNGPEKAAGLLDQLLKGTA